MSDTRFEGEGMTEFTMRRLRNEIIEQCAKAVEETMWTLPLYASSCNINVATGEAATIVIRQTAEAVRALAVSSQERP